MGDGHDEDEERLWGKHVRAEVLGHGARVRRLPRRASKDGDEHPRAPSILAANLRRLTGLSGMTPSEVAARAGGSRRWYRRLADRGIARIDKRTREGLERLARLFGLKGVEDFCDPDLDRLRP